MKAIWPMIIFSVLLFSAPLAAESRNCTESVIMGVGPHSNPQQCKAGDIIKLPIRRIAELCNFNYAIACNGEGKRSLCYCTLRQKYRKPR